MMTLSNKQYGMVFYLLTISGLKAREQQMIENKN